MAVATISSAGSVVTPPQVVYFAILIAASALLLSERMRPDLVAVLVLLALYASGLLTSAEALAGFSSEPAIVVAGIFVLSAALHQTELSELAGSWIGRLAGSSYTRMLAVIMPSVAALSAFTHHVTMTAVMLPVTLKLARERGVPASKLLMPVSFAASLGTTMTIIGAPAFLIAASVLQQAGRPSLGVFSIAPIGIALSLVGTIYMLLIGHLLLPARRQGEEPGEHFRLGEYLTEVSVRPDSPLVGKTLQEAQEDERYRFGVVGWLRHGQPLLPPFEQRRLQSGDVLLVHTSPEELVRIREEPGVELRPDEQYEAQPPGTNGSATDGPGDEDEEPTAWLVQAIVAPRSELAGRTLAEVDFRRRYGAVVLGLWRKGAWPQEELSKVRLQEGDVLVIQAGEDAAARLAGEPDFLMLVPFQGEPRRRRKAFLAGAIMLLTVVAAAFSWLPLEMAALGGAAAVVLSGCLTPRQAYRAIDHRIYVFIAGAIPLGTAMEKTGSAKLLAAWLERVVAGWPASLVLFATFCIVAVVTQFMSDSATTAIFAPVALALAQALGQAPEPFVVTVAMAAVAAFLTPIGHHGNLLVYSPGRYQFADFVKAGTPLTILVGIVVAVLAPLIWHG